jgi:Ca-activated chloride channel family protein
MRIFEDKFMKLAVIALIVFGLIFGIVTATQNWGKNKNTVNAEAAVARLERLYGRLNVHTLIPRKDAGFTDDDAIAVLPDISEYPFVVNPATDNFITIYAAPESIGWLSAVAEDFNKSDASVDGKLVSVGIRSIPSGLAGDFISSGKYTPDIFAPSNELWGDMIKARGAQVSLLEKRLVGNVAGVILSRKKGDEMAAKYGELNGKSIVDSILNGEAEISYTSPSSSSEGLNFLLTALSVFDGENPLSESSVAQLRKFQDRIPYVAYESTQLKDSVLAGTLDGFVSDYHTYVNSPELRASFVFIPFGVRHDQPVYEIGKLSELKRQAAAKFVEFCKTAESQKTASDEGFNGLDDYFFTIADMSGTTIAQAQETWKKEKNGSSDLTAVFVADISGSMEGSPLLKLKASLNRASSFIDENTNVGFVTFSDEVNVALPIAKFDFNQKAYFANAVKRRSAGGGTAMFDAVVVAEKMLVDAKAKNPNTKRMLIVLTDGITNRGYSFGDIEQITIGLRIPVYTIGYNEDIEILKRLSDINEATSINAETDDVIYKLESLFNSQM